jgi:hypothetical protein
MVGSGAGREVVCAMGEMVESGASPAGKTRPAGLVGAELVRPGLVRGREPDDERDEPELERFKFRGGK